MESIPKVSVCIPTFNGAAYVKDALDSVLGQSYRNFEIVIVDNDSTDGTEAIVEEFRACSDKVIYFKNSINIGISANFNKCLEYARGEYIKFLCVDDLLLPLCLEMMVNALDEHPAVSLVCGGRFSIDTLGQNFDLRRYSSKRQVVPGYMVITRCLFGRNYIGEPSAVMFRKSDVKSRFRVDLPQLMDMEMWLRLLEVGALLNIEIPLCSIRFHRERMTQENIKLGRLIEDNFRIFDEFSNRPYLKSTAWLNAKHKVLTTYRVWVSRKFITCETKTSVLRRSGMRIIYPLMPFISALVGAKRIFSSKVWRPRA